MNSEEIQYLNLLQKIITVNESSRETRNAPTYSVFGERLEFKLSNGFPLLTTKKVFFRAIVEELLFFLRGDTDTKKLEDKNIMIWHDNTTTEFLTKNNKNLNQYDMGPMYGYQWRYFGMPCMTDDMPYMTDDTGIDQLQNVIDLLVKDPYSRRIIMTSYNPTQAELGVLYPCHGIVIQFYLENKNEISLQMYQRSADCFLGLPFNIASYALLLHIIVNLVNNNVSRSHTDDYVPGRLIIITGDTHIYVDHVNAVREQLKNEPYPFCKLRLNKKLVTLKDINQLQYSDIELVDYLSHGSIKAKMFA